MTPSNKNTVVKALCITTPSPPPKGQPLSDHRILPSYALSPRESQFCHQNLRSAFSGHSLFLSLDNPQRRSSKKSYSSSWFFFPKAGDIVGQHLVMLRGYSRLYAPNHSWWYSPCQDQMQVGCVQGECHTCCSITSTPILSVDLTEHILSLSR